MSQNVSQKKMSAKKSIKLKIKNLENIFFSAKNNPNKNTQTNTSNDNTAEDEETKTNTLTNSRCIKPQTEIEIAYKNALNDYLQQMQQISKNLKNIDKSKSLPEVQSRIKAQIMNSITLVFGIISPQVLSEQNIDYMMSKQCEPREFAKKIKILIKHLKSNEPQTKTFYSKKVFLESNLREIKNAPQGIAVCRT